MRSVRECCCPLATGSLAAYRSFSPPVPSRVLVQSSGVPLMSPSMSCHWTSKCATVAGWRALPIAVIRLTVNPTARCPSPGDACWHRSQAGNLLFSPRLAYRALWATLSFSAFGCCCWPPARPVPARRGRQVQLSIVESIVCSLPHWLTGVFLFSFIEWHAVG